MEVIQRDNLTLVRIVNSIYASNTYLLHADGCSQAWLIDCGDFDPVHDYLCKKELCVCGVFLTHVHYDHIYGLKALASHTFGMIVYTTQEGVQSLQEPKYNFSKYYGINFRFSSDLIQVLDDRSSIELFPKTKLLSYKTPGHDWSSLTFCVNEFLFTGDSYIPGLKTVTTFPKSNRQKAEDSLILIKQLIMPSSVICPGHGQIYDMTL